MNRSSTSLTFSRRALLPNAHSTSRGRAVRCVLVSLIALSALAHSVAAQAQQSVSVKAGEGEREPQANITGRLLTKAGPVKDGWIEVWALDRSTSAKAVELPIPLCRVDASANGTFACSIDDQGSKIGPFAQLWYRAGGSVLDTQEGTTELAIEPQVLPEPISGILRAGGAHVGNLVLRPSTQFNLRVLTPDGVPIAGARMVLVLGYGRFDDSSLSRVSNATGVIRIGGLPSTPGQYFLYAEGYPLLQQPWIANNDSQTPVDVHLERPRRVSGLVQMLSPKTPTQDSPTQGVAGVEVRLNNPGLWDPALRALEMPDPTTTITDAQGRFTLPLSIDSRNAVQHLYFEALNNDFEVRAPRGWPTPSQPTQEANETLEVDRPVILVRKTSLSILVQDHAKNPIANVSLQSNRDDTGGFGQQRVTNEDGTTTLWQEPGFIRISAEAAGYKPSSVVKELRAGVQGQVVIRLDEFASRQLKVKVLSADGSLPSGRISGRWRQQQDELSEPLEGWFGLDLTETGEDLVEGLPIGPVEVELSLYECSQEQEKYFDLEAITTEVVWQLPTNSPQNGPTWCCVGWSRQPRVRCRSVIRRAFLHR